jgi:hypothetical protein
MICPPLDSSAGCQESESVLTDAFEHVSFRAHDQQFIIFVHSCFHIMTPFPFWN